MTIKTNLPITSFNKGLITEASPLDFPMGASLDEINMKLLNDGTRERRLGLNIELGGVYHFTGYTDAQLRSLRISYHDWPSPNNNPNLHIGGIQIGNRMWFIDVTKPNPSAHILNGGNPVTAEVSGTPFVTSAYINGYLVLTCHEFGRVLYLAYDPVNDIVSHGEFPILIRDFTGVDDNLPINERPVTLSDQHRYNLINQGWLDSIITKGIEISETQDIGFPEGVGANPGNILVGGVTVGLQATDNPWDVAAKVATAINGQVLDNSTFPVRAESFSSNIIKLTYDKRDGPVDLVTIVDSGSILAAPPIITRNTTGVYELGGNVLDEVFEKTGHYPSNIDIWSLGQIPDDTDPNVHKFDPEIWVNNSPIINTHAPKGHFIIDAFKRDESRRQVSGIEGLVTDTDHTTVSVCATMAGRLFFSGSVTALENPDQLSIPSSNCIYFSQIAENVDKFPKCYQEADPTSKDFNEPVASDGGVIVVPGMATVVRLMASEGSLFAFATNGIWQVEGGQGGFTAIDYKVEKISNISVISPYSILEVNGDFIFWAKEGIYRLEKNQYGRWETNSISADSIQRLYNNLPSEVKKNAKGYYDISKNQCRWMYHSDYPKEEFQPISLPPYAGIVGGDLPVHTPGTPVLPPPPPPPKVIPEPPPPLPPPPPPEDPVVPVPSDPVVIQMNGIDVDLHSQFVLGLNSNRSLVTYTILPENQVFVTLVDTSGTDPIIIQSVLLQAENPSVANMCRLDNNRAFCRILNPGNRSSNCYIINIQGDSITIGPRYVSPVEAVVSYSDIVRLNSNQVAGCFWRTGFQECQQIITINGYDISFGHISTNTIDFGLASPNPPTPYTGITGLKAYEISEGVFSTQVVSNSYYDSFFGYSYSKGVITIKELNSNGFINSSGNDSRTEFIPSRTDSVHQGTWHAAYLMGDFGVVGTNARPGNPPQNYRAHNLRVVQWDGTKFKPPISTTWVPGAPRDEFTQSTLSGYTPGIDWGFMVSRVRDWVVATVTARENTSWNASLAQPSPYIYIHAYYPKPDGGLEREWRRVVLPRGDAASLHSIHMDRCSDTKLLAVGATGGKAVAWLITLTGE